MSTTDSPTDSPPENEKKDRKGLLLLLLLLLLVIGLSIWFGWFSGRDDDNGSASAGAAETVGLNEGDLDDDDSVRAFIRRYIRSGESNDPAAEMSFYAEAVDSYFDKPSFDKAAILKDRTNFVNKWPERSYTIVGEPEIVERQDDVVIAKAQYRYTVKNGETESSGTGRAFYRIRQRGKDLEIFWVGETLE